MCWRGGDGMNGRGWKNNEAMFHYYKYCGGGSGSGGSGGRHDYFALVANVR